MSGGKFAEDDGIERDEGNDGKDHQRELIIENQHRGQNTDDDKAVFHEIHEKIREHHRDCVGIVRHACDECTDGNAVQLRMRKIFDMTENIFSERGEDLLSRFLQNEGLYECAPVRKTIQPFGFKIVGKIQIQIRRIELFIHLLI